MKILLGLPEYPPYNVGGGGEVFKKIAEGFRALGHDVVVLYGYYNTKSFNEKIEKYKDESGIVFYKIPEIPTPSKYPFLKTVMPPNLKSWFSLEKIIKEENPDIVYLHGYGLVLVNIIANICKKLQIKYIYTLHGAPVTQNKVGGFIKFAYTIYKYLYGHKTLKNAYKITAVSKYTTEFDEFKQFKNDIIVINNGIDTKQYINLKGKLNIGNFKRDYIEIVSLGRLEWLKGFQYFIDIIPDLIKSGYNIKYKIAGTDNGLKSDLEKKISDLNVKDNVEFVGQLDFEEKINFILNSDYVLVPSLVENYPAVPIESIILGKPVIANRAGGIPEIVKNDINGFLTDVTDKKVFLKDMLNILGQQYILKAQDIDFYDWKEKVNEYIKLI